MLLLTFTLSCFGVLIVSNYKVYVHSDHTTSNTNDDSYLTAVGAIASISNSASRFLWGWLLDKFAFKLLLYILFFIQAVVAGTIQFVADSKIFYFIYIQIVLLCYGGLYAIMPAYSTKVFGRSYGTRLYGVIFQGFSLSSWVQFGIVKGL